MDALSNRDLGNFRSGSGQIFVMFCEPSLSRLNTWSCWRVTALVECCDHEGTYWVGDLCQLDPEIPNSTLNCHTVISVIHFTSPLNVVTVSHLRTPQDPPGGAGGRFCRERETSGRPCSDFCHHESTLDERQKMDGWMDGWMDGRTDGRTDGWMDVTSCRVFRLTRITNMSSTIRHSGSFILK